VSWSAGPVDEPGDGNDLDPALLEIHHGDQGIDKGDLEHTGGAADEKPILARSGEDSLDLSDLGAGIIEDDEPDQLLGPEFALEQRTSLSNGNDGAPDFFGALTIGDASEGNLEPAIGATDLAHGLGLITDIDNRAGLEADHVVLVYVNAEKSVEAMGTAQPPDDVPLGLSRGTRPQQ
jgi:hypothetical protein